MGERSGRIRLDARSVLTCVILLAACTTGCTDKDAPASTHMDAGGTGPSDGGAPDAFFPVTEAADPCELAGYVFDGKSDCNEVRCPDLTCDCAALARPDAGVPVAPAESVSLHACVPARGCLGVVDCNRVCDPAGALARDACQRRIEAAGSLACESDAQCVIGECREERIGSVCVDALGCAENGNCGAGSACLFDPDALDPTTSLPTTLGVCADGSRDSPCFEDDDCVFDRCLSNRCSGGLDGETCKFNAHCASGHCRITNATDATGDCVSGKAGSPCVDVGDCGDGLHCTGSTCFTNEVGQSCENDAQCASGICTYGLCRMGELGSLCMDDGDCAASFCVNARCASGTLLAPCTDVGDCKGGLACSHALCSDGSVGMPCASDAECSVHACAIGACSEGKNGGDCDQDSDCLSNRCADPAGVEYGACTSGNPGSHCEYAANCKSNSCVLGECQ